MNSKRRKSFLVFIAAALALGCQFMPAASHLGAGAPAVYAAGSVSAEMVGSASGTQGEQNVVASIEIKNSGTSTLEFDSAELEFNKAVDVSITGGSTGKVTLEENESTTVSFYLDIGKDADTGTRYFRLILKNGGTSVYDNDAGYLTIYEKTATLKPDTGKYISAVDIAHTIKPSGGFSEGQQNIITFNITNNGNSLIQNAEVSLTLPEGLSMDNASNSQFLGYLARNSHHECSFPIAVESNASSKNYAITLELTGLDFSDDAVSLKKTFYIPVNGAGGSIKNAEIANISVPGEVSGDQNFNLSFDVKNNSNADLKNVKVNVEIPEGLLNKSRSAFIESSIPAGSSKNYSVTMSAADGAKEKAYPIKISLSSSTAADSAADVIQYASVYVSGAGSEKTPQLMVDNYSYGGTFAQAGDEFLLELGLYNASGSRTISNIKVTVSSEDGAIIPVNSSNSFFIEKLGKKERTNQSLLLTVKPNAEQKTTPLTVDMSYEDGSGNAFTSKDIISIPVMQETRLEVDDIIAPPELYAGMQSGLSVQFYNMGKTTLNNLRVTAEGDFDTPESTSYFVGNMESGKSDTYDFSFIPRKGGTMEGKVIFAYEDAAGDVQTLERPFSFQIQAEMPAMEEAPPADAAGKGGGHKALWIGLGVLALLIGGGIFAWRKIRKRKLHREMEIDE